MTEVDTDVRERVATACRVLGVLGLARDSTGHASARLPGTRRIFIRGRGADEIGLRYTSLNQIVEVDLSGRLVESGHDQIDAPREVYIHTEIYRLRPDVCGVVHVHPVSVFLMTICRKPLLPLYGAYDPPSAKLAIDGIPDYPRSYLCDTADRGKDLAQCLGDSPCCTMRGHGLTSCGPNVEEAALMAIHLNDLAEVNYRASLLGGAHEIPEDEREWIKTGGRFAPSTSVGAPPVDRAGALWRYYLSLTGN
jgi:ribulose-5-phosphate 4-epimerase/fuculose-1-phosphate aldolase